MSRPHGKLSISKAIRRRVGMGDEGREKMEASMREAEDWRGTCSRCKKTLTGSMSRLMEHAGECV